MNQQDNIAMEALFDLQTDILNNNSSNNNESLESFFSTDKFTKLIALNDVLPTNHISYLKMRQGLEELRAKLNLSNCSNGEDDCNKLPPVIARSENSEYMLIVDIKLLLDIMFAEPKVISSFLRNAINLSKTDTLRVVVQFDAIESIDLFIVFDGVAVSNLIRQIPCHKIFQFDSPVSITELVIAAACDEVEISEFAAVTITKAENGENIMKYALDTYRHLVKNTYHFWKDKGLFTASEITGLFSAESDHSILILSDEIKRRLNK